MHWRHQKHVQDYELCRTLCKFTFLELNGLMKELLMIWVNKGFIKDLINISEYLNIHDWFALSYDEIQNDYHLSSLIKYNLLVLACWAMLKTSQPLQCTQWTMYKVNTKYAVQTNKRNQFCCIGCTHSTAKLFPLWKQILLLGGRWTWKRTVDLCPLVGWIGPLGWVGQY